jgi:hypothetical protein
MKGGVVTSCLVLFLALLKKGFLKKFTLHFIYLHQERSLTNTLVLLYGMFFEFFQQPKKYPSTLEKQMRFKTELAKILSNPKFQLHAKLHKYTQICRRDDRGTATAFEEPFSSAVEIGSSNMDGTTAIHRTPVRRTPVCRTPVR